jgi:hypothetical protein
MKMFYHRKNNALVLPKNSNLKNNFVYREKEVNLEKKEADLKKEDYDFI